MSRLPLTPDAVGQIRAPQEHGQIVSHPELATARGLAEANRSALAQSAIQIFNRPLTEFRDRARAACQEAAARWMESTLGIIPTSTPPRGLLFVTGHQPLLSHPGVWMKNVVVDALAKAADGTGMNLIVDNDLAETESIRIPTGDRAQPLFGVLPFDAPQPRQPWEELHVADRNLFETFAQRAAESLRTWSIDPLVTKIWGRATEFLGRMERTGDCLSAVRVAQEQRWDMRNLELPVSALCRTQPFLEFVAHLVRDAPRFVKIHNRAVQEYRRRHRIRHDRQPVPDLEHRSDSWELPFWFWRPGDHDRARVFVRTAGERVELLAGETLLASIVPGNEVDALQELQLSGRLRTRALSTTLFARLCFADLFVHGIGGAKYDEITDVIIERYFGLSAPKFLTLTATLHLPLGAQAIDDETVRLLKQQLRDLRFNAERLVVADQDEGLVARKRRLITESHAERTLELSRRERALHRPVRHRRHLELAEIESELARHAEPQRRRIHEELDRALAGLRAGEVLNSREFPALLFPEPMLAELIDRLRKSVV